MAKKKPVPEEPISFMARLKRHHIFRVASAYAVAAYVLVLVANAVFPDIGLSRAAVRYIIAAAALLFPVALVLGWMFIPPSKQNPDKFSHWQQLRFRLGSVLTVVIVVLVTLSGMYLWHVNERYMRLEAGSKPSAVTPPPAFATSIPPNSIAVLPFTNLSADKNQDYFSDGISEDLLNLLASVPQLQVTARTSSFYFQGKNLPISEIARRLHVAHILEGSVQKVGNQVRISVQLVDTGSDTQLWSQTWDRTFDDIFKIQDQVATAVVKALKIKLLGAAPKVRTTDPQAYALYLQAKALGLQFTPEAFKQSDALYRQVLAIDPHYAPAWGGLARNFANEGNIGMMSSREGLARSREAAEKALAIDPDYAPAYAQLGWIAKGDNNLAGAAKYTEHALVLDPTELGILGDAAVLLSDLGHLNEALMLQKALARRDPVNVTLLYDLGYTQRKAGHFDAAIASFHTVLSLSPPRGRAHAMLGIALLLKGDAPAALAEIEQEPNESWRMIALPLAYCALGRKTQADKAFTALIDKYEKEDPYNIAYDYAYCGKADQAFEWLDKAVQYQDSGLNEIVSENLFDKIHSDPRWLPFLRKIGKAPEQLAKIQFKVSVPKAWQTRDAAAKATESGQ